MKTKEEIIKSINEKCSLVKDLEEERDRRLARGTQPGLGADIWELERDISLLEWVLDIK